MLLVKTKSVKRERMRRKTLKMFAKIRSQDTKSFWSKNQTIPALCCESISNLHTNLIVFLNSTLNDTTYRSHRAITRSQYPWAWRRGHLHTSNIKSLRISEEQQEDSLRTNILMLLSVTKLSRAPSFQRCQMKLWALRLRDARHPSRGREKDGASLLKMSC